MVKTGMSRENCKRSQPSDGCLILDLRSPTILRQRTLQINLTSPNLGSYQRDYVSFQLKILFCYFQNEPGPVKKWWKSLNNNEKVFYPILAANVLVFGAWRVKAWQPFMIKYFCSNPQGSKLIYLNYFLIK